MLSRVTGEWVEFQTATAAQNFCFGADREDRADLSALAPFAGDLAPEFAPSRWIATNSLTKIVIYMMIISMSESRERVELLELGAGAPVRRVPLALARRFLQICTTAGAEVVSKAGLTPQEFAVMAYVNSVDGEPDLDQSALAARLGVDRNSTSLLVGSLEAKGLVERRVSEADRRVRLVRLTPRGEKLFAALHPKAIELQQHVLDVLAPAERELLIDLLVRVIEANPDRARPGAGRRKRSSNGQTR